MKNIEIVFENCESIVIPAERIEKFEPGKQEPMNGPDAFYSAETYRTDSVLLAIRYSEDAELLYNATDFDAPLGLYEGNPLSNSVVDRPNILGRILNSSDITFIEMLEEDGKIIKSFYVPWHEEDQYENRWMRVKQEKGLLTIEINEH